MLKQESVGTRENAPPEAAGYSGPSAADSPTRAVTTYIDFVAAFAMEL